jgi:hypothetical protein
MTQRETNRLTFGGEIAATKQCTFTCQIDSTTAYRRTIAVENTKMQNSR